MAENETPLWLTWAREIHALAQTGLHYAENDFQRDRYIRLLEIASEIASSHSQIPQKEILIAYQAQKGYITPKVDVRAAIFRKSKLLLVRERIDNDWCMPGGWADVGDIPSKAIEREVWEETGFEVRATRIISVYDCNRVTPLPLFHAYKLVFLCEIINGAARPSQETSQVEFFGIDEIPGNLSSNRTTIRHISDAFNAYKNPCLHTVFD
jgi:ADP-ribose pyrophosphatase YjhB (NUDIX family)